MADDKKIIIDDDWKQQAQKEKETLSEQQEKEQLEKEQPKKLPKGDFPGLVNMLVTNIFFALGILQMDGEQKEPNFEMAKYYIDLLEALHEKTKGNLTEQEVKMMESITNEVRMAFVKVAGV